MAMGMMIGAALPVVSLPFKLGFFVLADGGSNHRSVAAGYVL